MPLFGSKEKKAKKSLERSESWSLGKGASKNNREKSKDTVFENPKGSLPPPQIAEMGTGVDPPRIVEQQSRSNVYNTESSKAFAVELDSSTISSLPPSHRDGGSITGSEATQVASTRATSITSNPSDRLNQELLAPDNAEKEVAVSKAPIASRTISMNSSRFSDLPADKEAYSPSLGGSRPESTMFSLQSTISRGYREFNFYNTPNFKHLVICDPSQRALFFAEIFSHTRSKSDVELREFGDELNVMGTRSMKLDESELAKTRVVAVADFVPNENAKAIKLGIGDPLDPASNTWVVLKNVTPEDAPQGVEKFDMPVPGPDGTTVMFQWIKGSAGDTDGAEEASDAKEAYRLVCDEGVVASFRNTSMTNVRKRGALRVYEGQTMEQYLLLIFLSASAMSEMYRRRRCKKVRKSMLIPF